MAFDPDRAIFYAVEIGMFSPSQAAGGPGWAAAPWALMPWGTQGSTARPSASAVLLASDLGYRTRTTDAGGLQVYPPLVSQAFAITRQLNLEITRTGVGWAWGTIVLSDATGAYDAIATSSNSDHQDIVIYAGQKTLDLARMYQVDPSKASLTKLFQGIGQQWTLDASNLNVPIRDATYWIEQPLQQSAYGGSGGTDGSAALAGSRKPKLRGGTSSAPVRNITPILIDPTNLVYQYTDAPGQIIVLYDGGDPAAIASAGDVADLYVGTCPTGQYRTCNARGMFQLGSKPTRGITIDAIGAFPSGSYFSTPADLAYHLLTEDLALPTIYLDKPSFTAAATAHPYVAGWYFDPSTQAQGDAALDPFLAALNANLIPLRSGLLSLYVLRAIPSGATVVRQIDKSNIISITPSTLPASLTPAPYRFRVGYQHNFTIVANNLSPNASSAWAQFAAASDSYAVAASTAVLAAYRRPNDPDPVTTALLRQADAADLASALIKLWSANEVGRLYDVEMPVSIGVSLELGNVVRMVYPIADLAAGLSAQIVGEQFTSGKASLTLTMLVNAQ